MFVAENARMLSQYDVIGKKPMRIMYKRDKSSRENPEANLFVRNIDSNVSHKELHNFFATIGNVTIVKIAYSSKSGQLDYGYVQMEKKEDAQKALETLDNHKLREKELIVRHFEPRVNRSTGTRNNLYVKNFGFNDKTKEEVEKMIDVNNLPY